jgi:preprotein translocase subunit SecA
MDKALDDVQQQVATLYKDADDAQTVAVITGNNGALTSLTAWLERSFNYKADPTKLAALNREQLERKLETVVEDRHRPEMRRLERELVLQILDTAWKDHLLAMDHLRSSVGLRGYAQIDPKVEYKREGMRTFELMWSSVAERVTDLIFRMEQVDETSASPWTEGEAIHEEAPPATDISAQQQAAIDGTQVDRKMEPIRNRQEHVGRNDPCPCGSGKKFKNCCMRKNGGP